MKSFLFRLMIVALAFGAASRLASARELWVDRESRGGACSDSRAAAAVAKTAPLCTLGAAANMVLPGDTVTIRGGTYTERHTCPTCSDIAVLEPVRAGTASQPIRFIAAAGETVVLQGRGAGVQHGLRIVKKDSQPLPSFNEVSGLTIKGFKGDCVATSAVPDLKLNKLDISGCSRQSVALHYAQRVTLEGSKIHDSTTNGWTSAVDLWNCKDGNVVRGNWIWNNADQTPGQSDTEGHGLVMDYCGAAGGALIENNVIWANEGWCMVIINSDHATIRNNTCFHNGRRPDGSGEISTAGNYLLIENNLLAPQPGHRALNIRFARTGFTANLATIRENYNFFAIAPTAAGLGWGDSAGTLGQYQQGNSQGWGKNSRTGDPRFVNPAAADLRLAAGSEAIDGANPAQSPAIDADGKTRPIGQGVDFGAYEAGTASGTLPAPTNLRIVK